MTDKSSVIVSCMTEKYLMEASVLLSCDDGAYDLLCHADSNCCCCNLWFGVEYDPNYS